MGEGSGNRCSEENLVSHTTLQPEVVAPVSTCAITSSFSPSICESPVTVMTTQATQRSIPTLSQPVCSSQVQHTSQLYLKAETKPTTTQIRSFAQPIYQPITEGTQMGTIPTSVSITQFPIHRHLEGLSTGSQMLYTLANSASQLPMNQGTSYVNPSVSQPMPLHSQLMQRRGKAPPIDPFTAEDKEVRFDDWIPTLERAATWNNWLEEETLMQLAGHLRGKALQEWNLMSAEDKNNYQSAITTLRMRLDPGNKTLAAFDFRHITQKESESVSDFIMRLERTFQIAFGRDHMSAETRDVLLYGKLQDGLRIDLVSKAPAISGAQNYHISKNAYYVKFLELKNEQPAVFMICLIKQGLS